MGNGPVLGEIYVRGKMHDGRYDKKDSNLFSLAGFLSRKYLKVYLKTAEGEKHLLPNVEETLDNPNRIFMSYYVRVNHGTVTDILNRTLKKYNKMCEKQLEEPVDHLNTLERRLGYLFELARGNRELIELIGAGSIIGAEFTGEHNGGIMRKIGNVAINSSYRSMKYGTNVFGELTDTALNLNGIPADIITFRTSNPWIINGVVRGIKKSHGYNYALVGEATRADGRGRILQYMLFHNAKKEFEENLAYAEARCQTASAVLKPFYSTITEFMDKGIEKVSLKELKDQYMILDAFPTPEQFEIGGEFDDQDIEKYARQIENTYTPEHKISYEAASIALSNKGQYAFLPEFFEKLIDTLDSFGCHDLEEFNLCDNKYTQAESRPVAVG